MANPVQNGNTQPLLQRAGAKAQRQALSRAARRGQDVIKLDRGLYQRGFELTEWHDFATVGIRKPDAVVCLTSALFYHRLTTTVPPAVVIGLDAGRHAPRWRYPAIEVVYLNPTRWPLGIDTVEIEGIPVRITDPARTVVDHFRFRKTHGTPLFLEALRTGLSDRIVTAEQCWSAAEHLGVQDDIRPYLDALAPGL